MADVILSDNINTLEKKALEKENSVLRLQLKESDEISRSWQRRYAALEISCNLFRNNSANAAALWEECLAARTLVEHLVAYIDEGNDSEEVYQKTMKDYHLLHEKFPNPYFTRGGAAS